MPGMQTKGFDVAIRGGGVVGHTLALLLARERLRVALVARAPAPGGTPDIRAYAINSASQALLASLRVWPQAPHVTPVREMHVSDAVDQGPALCFAARDIGADTLAWIADVPELERQLAEAVRYQSGIERVEQAPPDVALTVVCEGRHSSSRDALGLTPQTHPYPHTAVAARLSTERAHGAIAHQWFCQGEVLALLPREGELGNSVALVWSVGHARAQELLAMNAATFVDTLQAACGDALGTLRLEGAPAAWPLTLSRAPHWVRPGVALAGDAAHTLHPLAGLGLNVGLGDAAALAQVIAQREPWRPLGDLRLLRRYERARQAEVRLLGGVTDGLFQLFSPAHDRLQPLRHWGLAGFHRSGPIKRWATRIAMGLTAPQP